MSEVDTLSGDNSTVYTPTTEDLRISFPEVWRTERQDDGNLSSFRHTVSIAEFDRWLTDVKAAVWDEGYVSSDDYYGNPDNPYRQGETK